MLSVKVICPTDLTSELIDELTNDHAVMDIELHASKSVRPPGDVIEFDIAPEAGNRLIARLRQLGIDKTGSIKVSRASIMFSELARNAELITEGIESESVMWEEVEVRVRSEAKLAPTFVLLTMCAALIAAVGLITDSTILLVGAMVVGPEYGALAHMSIGLQRRTAYRVKEGAVSLAVAFGLAATASALMTLALRSTGLLPEAFRHGNHPLTAFVARPDFYTALIAFLAAVAGTLSLTQAKSGTLIGVFVSVTTIPAVANMGVAAALGRWAEFAGATWQLLVNVNVIVFTGAGCMWLQRKFLSNGARSKRARNSGSTDPTGNNRP